MSARILLQTVGTAEIVPEGPVDIARFDEIGLGEVRSPGLLRTLWRWLLAAPEATDPESDPVLLAAARRVELGGEEQGARTDVRPGETVR